MSCGGACGVGRSTGRGHGIRTWAGMLAVGAATACGGPRAWGQASGGTEAELRRLVALLDSPTYAVRQEATIGLTNERFSISRLEEELRNPDLTPEQRQRLLHAHRERFARTPRAAMGVSFEFLLPQRVVINRTHEPFHVSRVLEPGDLIISAEGVRLHGPDAAARIRSVILSHDPGEEVELEVRRGPEKLAVKVRVGQWTDFREPTRGSPQETDIAAAWNVRIARVTGGMGGGTGTAPIETGLTGEQWAEMELAARIRRGNHQANLVRQGAAGVQPARMLLAGGRARNDLPDEMDRERVELNGKDELNIQQWQRIQRMEQRVMPRSAPEAVENEIARLRQNMDRLREEIQRRRQRPQVDTSDLERDLQIAERLVEALQADAADR